MKKVFAFIALTLVLCLISACIPESASDIEQTANEGAQISMVQNQPAPNLGGFSFERQVIIETYKARNNTISTYAYMITMDGKIIEICPSIGYPIPYATQLTNPAKIEYSYGETQVLPNAEPNGLHSPADAAATLVQCANPDGSVSPVYIEWYVLAFPYQIKSDFALERIGDTSFSVDLK